MLIQISLTNFFSLRDTAILDLKASNCRAFKNSETAGNVFSEDGTTLLKSLAIFGANASGKSNLLKAIDACIQYIRESHNFNETHIADYEPFKLSDGVAPSVFEIEMMIEGERYEYGFSLLRGKIVEEHLYSYPKKYKALVFKREASQSEEPAYVFSKRFSRPKEVVANTSAYTLFLTRAALMNRSEAIKVLDFVTNRIAIGLPSFESNTLELLLQSHKNAVLEALRYADSDIVDFEFKTGADSRGGKRLTTYHRSNPETPFDFYKEESAGTRRLLQLLTAFIDVAEAGKVLILDEIETSLHPQLVNYALRLFNRSEKAQMIFSTHMLDLLRTDALRPDQIYFVSKDYDNGSSELYSLADFSDYRNYKDLQRDYRQGRFDAIPILPTL